MVNKDKLTGDLSRVAIAVSLIAIILPMKIRAHESYVREKYIGTVITDNNLGYELSYETVKPQVYEEPIEEEIIIHEEEEDWVDPSKFRIDVTQEEIDLMARAVMSEASMLDKVGKQAVATVIVNRVLSDYRSFKYATSVYDVIIPGQFSIEHNGEVTEDCYEAVYEALMYEGFPTDMLLFWKSSTPPDGYYSYTSLGDGIWKTYFFTLEDYAG